MSALLYITECTSPNSMRYFVTVFKITRVIEYEITIQFDFYIIDFKIDKNTRL
jgi:hypothetical protein